MKTITSLYILLLGGFCQAQTFTNYTTTEGLPHNNVTCLAADASNNIWFGTQDGVAFFDGTSFTVHNTSSDTGIAANTITAVFVASNGDVWIGTDYGASKYDGTSWTKYTTADGLGDDRVKHIAQDDSGNLWFGEYDGVTKFDGASTWTAYTTTDGLPFGGVVHTTFSANGDKWFSTDLGGTVHYDGTTFTSYKTTDGLLANGVRAVVVDAADKKWVGTAEGITVLDNANTWAENHTIMYVVPPPDTLNPVEDLAMDSQGNIWAGIYIDYLVTVGGIARFDGTLWIDYDESDGLVGPVIRKIIVDGVDNVWVATSTGVSRISGAVGIEEVEEQTPVSVFPNPASSQITIQMDHRGLLEVFDMQGRRVFHLSNFDQRHTENISAWETGMYLIRAGNGVKKLIVE